MSTIVEPLESEDSSAAREESSTTETIATFGISAEEQGESRRCQLESKETSGNGERDGTEILTAVGEADENSAIQSGSLAAAAACDVPESRRKTFTFQQVCQIICERTQKDMKGLQEGKKGSYRMHLFKIVQIIAKMKYAEDHPCVSDVFVAKNLWRVAAKSPSLSSLSDRAILEIVVLAMMTNPDNLKIQCYGIHELDALAERFDKTTIVTISNGHEVIIEAMKKFPNHDKLQGYGCRALQNLMRTKSNCRPIAEAGALEVASLVMNNRKLMPAAKICAINGVLCGLVHLCEVRALAIALRAVIALYHKQEDQLLKALMYLLYQLSSYYPEILAEEKESIVPGLVYVMQDYAYTGHIFGLGSGTLANLSSRGNGGIPAILADMDQHPTDHVTQICCLAALLYYTKKRRHHRSLGRAIPCITAAMKEFQGKCIILPQLAFIVLCNLTGVDNYCVIMAQGGVVNIASNIMTQHHPNHRILQRIGFVLLSNLATSNRGNLRAKIVRGGGCKALQGAMRLFREELGMQQFGRQTLLHLRIAFVWYFVIWFISSVDQLLPIDL